MEVRFTPEQEACLARIAASAGIDPESLVKDAALRLLEEDKLSGDRPRSPQEAAARIREIRTRTRSDPEGWTIQDYINHGRR